MLENKYTLSLINIYSEDPDKKANELQVLPLLAIEEENGNWYFKDSVGNRARTNKQQIKNFVFHNERIKVFGAVYLYSVYYPQYKPNSRALEELKTKLNGK